MKNLAIAALLGLTNATLLNQSDIDAERLFLEHLNTHGKSYGTVEEFEFRKQIFMDTLKEVQEWNANEKNTHTLDTNFLATWTKDERKKLNGYRADMVSEKREKYLDDSVLDSEVDWRERGAVSPVKNQGECGSCWAFSATQALEGAEQISGGYLFYLAPQFLVDCDPIDHGCQGGLMDYAFNFLETHKMMQEADYPYIGKVSPK